MRQFRTIFTIKGVFKLRGHGVNFASITLAYPEQDPDSVKILGAKFMRKRLRKIINIEDEARSGEKILQELKDANHLAFRMYAGADYFQNCEAERYAQEITKDYYASRGIKTA